MKTITCRFVLSATLLVTMISGYAKTTVDPQLVILNNKMSLIFQPLPNQEGKVLVKFKDDTETTLMEAEVDANTYQRKPVNFTLLEPGIYYLDIYHDGIITRKELLIRWDSIVVNRVTRINGDASTFLS